MGKENSFLTVSVFTRRTMLQRGKFSSSSSKELKEGFEQTIYVLASLAHH
jgi:hypothetical protein